MLRQYDSSAKIVVEIYKKKNMIMVYSRRPSKNGDQKNNSKWPRELKIQSTKQEQQWYKYHS